MDAVRTGCDGAPAAVHNAAVTDSDISLAAHQRSLGRRLLGWLLVVLAVLAIVAYTLGTWNPWRLVILEKDLSNPALGAVIFFALAFIASWVLAPVTNSAAQAGRLWLRFGLAIALIAALVALGVLSPLFSHQYTEASRSPRGTRAIAFVNKDRDDQQLRVWIGRGLRQRDVGALGHPCGDASVQFRGEDVVHVSTVYGDFDLRLDPASGKPLDVLGPTCSG
jgi:hypothetical protein